MSLREVSLIEVIEIIKFNGGCYCSCPNNFPSKIPTGLVFMGPPAPTKCTHLHLTFLNSYSKLSIDHMLYSRCCFVNGVHTTSSLHAGRPSLLSSTGARSTVGPLKTDRAFNVCMLLISSFIPGPGVYETQRYWNCGAPPSPPPLRRAAFFPGPSQGNRCFVASWEL